MDKVRDEEVARRKEISRWEDVCFRLALVACPAKMRMGGNERGTQRDALNG